MAPHKGPTGGNEENTEAIINAQVEQANKAVEAKRYLGLLASREKGGMTMEEAGEQVLLADEEDQLNLLDHSDANAGLDALLDALRECRTKGELQKLILNNRIREREGDEYAAAQREEEERDEFYNWQYHLSYDEYMIYEEEVLPLYIEEQLQIPQEVRDAHLEEMELEARAYENEGRDAGGNQPVRPQGTGEQGRDEGEHGEGEDTSAGEVHAPGRPVLAGSSRGEAQRDAGGLSKEAGQDADVAEAWVKAKAKNPGRIALMRIGDNYVAYGADAAVCADVLNIGTKGVADSRLERKAEFPHEALDTYLPKLISKGNKVAIFDNLKGGNTVPTESVTPKAEAESTSAEADTAAERYEKPEYGAADNEPVREHKADGVKALSAKERVLRDAVVERMRESGIEVIDDVEAGQKVLDAANEEVKLEAKHHSESAEKRRRVLGVVDEATAIVSGKDIKDVRAERMAREAEYKEETRDLYEKVLSGKFDDVTLQRINEYLDHVTPNNEYGRPLSKRLPPEVVRRVRKGERASEVDVLFSRICESAVPANERTRPEAKRRIEEKKKELLKAWAIATGNWHTSVEDFTHNTEPIGSGKDSVV